MTDGAPHEYKERPGACVDCGNSPVRHFEHYVANTLAVVSTDALAVGGVHAALLRAAGALFDHLEQPLQSALAHMPFASFSHDVEQATTYRSQVVWEEARRRGIRMEQLRLFGRGTEIYRAHIRGAWHYFQSLPIPTSQRAAADGSLDDKFRLKRTLKEAGVPVPPSTSVSSLETAIEAFHSIGAPAVVKPRSGSRGRHTTVNVRTQEDLETAFCVAQQLCRYVVVEGYLPGPVCRGTVVDGSLAGFFQADPPRVEGDGEAPIRVLVERANASRRERVQDIVLSDEHRRFLARLELTEDSVLEKGRTVPLTHRTGRLFGGATREILGAEHPKLRAYLERAARALGAGVVGFDLIIADPQSDPDEQQWGIIEANSLPYIDLHYLALDGRPSNVAARVWDLWDTPVHNGAVDAPDRSVTIRA